MSSRFASERVRALTPSPTLAVAKEAQRLRAQGIDVVDFGPGEPDFDTPDDARQAAIDAIRNGMTHYAPSRGIPELRHAIAGKLERENGLRYDPDTEIIVTPGAKQAIVEAILTVAGPSDEVIIFDPGWPSYESIVVLAGAQPVHVQLTNDFTIDADSFLAAITPRTRAIIVATPCNPTGHVLSEEELAVLANACIDHDLLLVSDEIYERITYPGYRVISAASLPGMWERTVTVNGFSKAYAMTGWRLGYSAAPAPLSADMLKVHEHTVTTATTFVQVGAVQALSGPQEPIVHMICEFARRREMISEGLNAIPGVSCVPPQGAFYAFPDISGTGQTGTTLADTLLGAGVALTPGCGFGAAWDTHVRISFATSEERIRTGLERMRAAIEAL